MLLQKAIDDLLRELNEKADLVQVASLRDDINNNLEKLSNRINAMMDIVGEPKSAAVAKKLFRNTACLSCSSPAHMDIEEPNTIPSLPVLPNSFLPSSIKADNTSEPKEDGDHGLCYPGKPIPHQKDPRLTNSCNIYNNLNYLHYISLLSEKSHNLISDLNIVEDIVVDRIQLYLLKKKELQLK